MAKTVTLRFVGPQHYREITRAQWKEGPGIDEDDVFVAGENAFVHANDHDTPQAVTLSSEAAEFLLETEGPLWEKVDKEFAGKKPREVHAMLRKKGVEVLSEVEEDDNTSIGDAADDTQVVSGSHTSSGGDSTGRSGGGRSGGARSTGGGTSGARSTR